MARKRILITEIKGIGDKRAEKLKKKSNIVTLKGLIRLTPPTLAERLGVSEETAEKFLDRARKKLEKAKEWRKKRRLRRIRKRRKRFKKLLFIVMDGLADTPMDSKTPLSEANTPNMDFFAKKGVCGELKLVPKKMPVASHVANIALLGYSPRKYYVKRGPLEAVGTGLPYEEGHLALRCNFATVDENLKVVDRRAGREVYGLDAIARSINRNVEIPARFVLIRTHGHRGALIVKERLSDQVVGNDPGKPEEKVKPIMALNERAEKSARLLREFVDKTHNLIEYHAKNAERIDRGLLPANYLLMRGAGNKLIAPPNFNRKWSIKNAVCIAEKGVMKATCMLAGFNAVTIPELGFEKTLDFVFENVESLLPGYDFVYVHLKGPDEPAHDGDFNRKRRVIEAIDERLEEYKGFNGVLVLTTDHITSCELKRHVRGNVPVLVYGKGKDKVKRFDEFSVKEGELKVKSGKQLLKYIFSK